METSLKAEDLNDIIAENLKALRRTRGMTLDDMASATGVSKSMLWQIERGECGLSVATLWKITTGLKLSFTALMKEGRTQTEVIDNKSVTPLTNGQSDFRLYPVFPTQMGRNFEILYIELDPGSKSSSEPHEPGTEEFTLVYEGVLTLTVGGETFQVPAGHSIRNSGDVPHQYANHGNSLLRLCMIVRYADQ